MIGQQHKPTKHDGHQQFLLGGPVFEFGPGWSVKTKKWFKKYVLGGNCALCRSSRYVLFFGLVILIFGGPQLKQLVSGPPKQTLTGQIKISETVQRGDSRIKLTRRALANYLAQFPDPVLTNGQKVFIETSLGQEITNDVFRTGVNVEFEIDDIESAIKKSKSLTPSQLQRWENAAKGVKF